MQLSDSPTLVPLPFADSGSKNVIPEAASPTPGLASLTTGFPPVTMTPLAAGGIPPAGQDMNGILNLITQSTRWAQGGGPYAYNSAFATDSNVNGYPQGSVISRADYTGQWISTADNNTVNPDTVGTNWVPGYNYGTTAVTGLTNANVTLTPAQAAKSRITLAGTLTGNVQIILPVWTKDWSIVNNTTGAFTVTCKTSAGTGIAIPQDASPTKITGDGTNITQPAENIPPATASQHAVQLGQATGRLLNVQIFTSSGTYTPSSSLVTSVVVEMVGGGGGGGGCASATTGLVALGGSGGGGGYAKARLISGFSGATVVVGASGTGGAAGVNNGGTGGASSFAGTAVVAQGGAGGVGSPANTPPFIIQGSSGAGASTGNIEAKPGDWSTIGIAIASNGARSGSGGASEFGIGANGVTGGNGSGATATSTFGYGGGGTGGVALSGGTAFAGGPGGPGEVIVWEYS